MEIIVGKGEIAHNEQFILFPQGFLAHGLPVIMHVIKALGKCGLV